MTTWIADLFFSRNFYLGLCLCMLLFVVGQFVNFMAVVAFIVLFIFTVLTLADFFMLFIRARPVVGERILASRLNNGNANRICWKIQNPLGFRARIVLVEEWPEQLQMRDWKSSVVLKPHQTKKICTEFLPTTRGEYSFGNVHLFLHTTLSLLNRRVTSEIPVTVPCYPTFFVHDRRGLNSDVVIDTREGNRRIRKIGQSMEFEQIKEYITGDDIRNLNWKATARRGMLMVNQYAYERAQRVYMIIDKGRLMKMPFAKMTLLDYAINSSLVLSSVCINRKDRVGLLTFASQVDSILAADNRPSHQKHIMETLYNQVTDFQESNFEALYETIRSRIKSRSMLILFTNFESRSGLGRQLKYLRSLAKYHLLVVVMFENAELKSFMRLEAEDVDMVYRKVVAEEFIFEKKLIARELSKYGINTILTKPNALTAEVINKYLELKSKFAL